MDFKYESHRQRYLQEKIIRLMENTDLIQCFDEFNFSVENVKATNILEYIIVILSGVNES